MTKSQGKEHKEEKKLNGPEHYSNTNLQNPLIASWMNRATHHFVIKIILKKH